MGFLLPDRAFGKKTDVVFLLETLQGCHRSNSEALYAGSGYRSLSGIAPYWQKPLRSLLKRIASEAHAERYSGDLEQETGDLAFYRIRQSEPC